MNMGGGGAFFWDAFQDERRGKRKKIIKRRKEEVLKKIRKDRKRYGNTKKGNRKQKNVYGKFFLFAWDVLQFLYRDTPL